MNQTGPYWILCMLSRNELELSENMPIPWTMVRSCNLNIFVEYFNENWWISFNLNPPETSSCRKKLYYIWARLRRWWANNMHATAPPSSAVFKAIGAIPKSSIIACYIICVCSKPLSASSWFMMISWIINNFETHGDPKSHDHISDKFPACCRNSAQFHPQIIISLSFVYAQILCRLIISLAFVLV